ncbi:hypothetical protein PsAD2_03080 [Pseudovibrio axinellae]|uniref:Uncharacterized protein n=1 Tax=Pseudovibrio axinellae TaxID=989403 RepID=A0A165XIS2_9HYPH|nr:hypothetical protein [Pseudovibrio axinellae]KZL17742.1 hypothetical protein PsAD2_03080 [Pseudovibrio axinellae]SER41609.1 hypothetical protein SAMN05421798_1101 [Pseudovibrio axinellae]
MICNIFNEINGTTLRSINEEEGNYIKAKIEEWKPKVFVEIGTASGLSGALICHWMEEYGAPAFHTIVLVT